MSDYLIDPQPGRRAPTIILQLVEGHIVATTGPRPTTIELPYKYGWNEAFQEETSDVVAAGYQVSFELTHPDVPLMYQEIVKAEDIGDWIVDVLHGADPRTL
ncbi:MAG TPA: hypothetical protein VNC22_23035 [Sporichthya sp.]|jgi:hypothetical protein|nr:hypothetical protein [Sporichthya sp.]